MGTGLGLYHFDPATGDYVVYTPENSALPSDDVDHLEATPDGSIWATTFDIDWPYPGGLTRFDGETWTTWTMTDSPLPHNQVWELTSRPTPTGYEVWVGTASEGVAVVTVTSPCPADIDGRGAVGFGDILAVLSAWGQAGGPEDLDGDGTVGFGDLLVVLGSWGPCP